MSCGLNKANFMKHLAPDGRIQATEVCTNDQAAHSAAIDRKERRTLIGPYAPGPLADGPGGWDKWRREQCAMENYHRMNTERGSANRNAGDPFEHY